jgi:hypothetical protein
MSERRMSTIRSEITPVAFRGNTRLDFTVFFPIFLFWLFYIILSEMNSVRYREWGEIKAVGNDIRQVEKRDSLGIHPRVNETQARPV